MIEVFGSLNPARVLLVVLIAVACATLAAGLIASLAFQRRSRRLNEACRPDPFLDRAD